MTPRFEYWKGADGQWYWRLKARNGKTLCHSEGYSGKSKCLDGIEAAFKAVHGIEEVKDVSA